MSLFSAMDGILMNDDALELAEEEMMELDDMAMEADTLIDKMVDGEDSDDELDEMEDDLDEADDIDDDDDAEEGCKKKACEAASPTGVSFLKSLMLDNDDPITTKNGSIGDSNGSADHEGNQSGSSSDTDDPITTKNGSIGDQNGAADHEKNQTNTKFDNDDPITTKNGSIGQKDSATESARFLGELMGEEVAVEGFIQNKKNASFEKKAQLVGTTDKRKEISDLISTKKYADAIRTGNKWVKELEGKKKSITQDDPNGKKKMKAISSLIKVASSLVLGAEKEKLQDKYVASGMSVKDAKKKATQDMKAQAKKETAAVESYILECMEEYAAMESSNNLLSNGSVDDVLESAMTFSDLLDGEVAEEATVMVMEQELEDMEDDLDAEMENATASLDESIDDMDDEFDE